MVYSKTLPRIDKIRSLAQLVGSFPATIYEISELARAHGFGENMQGFLGLFPDNGTFESVDDFITLCQELEVLMREEREAQDEILRSP